MFRLLALALLLSIAPLARAADNTDADERFPKGLWALDLTGSYVTPIRFSDNKFYNSTLTLEHYLADRFSLGAQLEGYYTEQESSDNNTVLGGIGLTLRLHLYENGKFSFFIDG